MLVVICHQRGLDEWDVARTWTFRRLLHAYIILMRDRVWFMPMVQNVLGGVFGTDKSSGKSSSGAPSRSEKPANPGRRIPSWFKPKKRGARISWAHVEDPLPYIAKVVPIGMGKSDGKRAMSNWSGAKRPS